MVQRLWVLLFVVVSACFSPSFEDGQITCGPQDSCPPGLTCSAGLCRTGTVPADAGMSYKLTVTPGGNGTGTVTSSPNGITCGSDCTESYAASTVVTLTAAPSASSTFVGWSGACTGTGTCTVTMSADINVTANFALQYSLVVALAGNGAGFVTSNPSGISCGTDCTESYTPSTVVTLTALAVTGSTFDSWSGGGCSGTGTCTVTLDAAKMVTATFSLTKSGLTVTTAGNGAGVVSSAPAGITCGVDCTEAYDYNTMVTLTATPNTGSTFTGWSGGGCTGTSTCVVTMGAATTVTATFTLSTWLMTVTKTGNGAGTVTSSPAGVNCGIDCSEIYDYNTTVTLSATPTTGSVFAGWAGSGCSGTGSCVVTMTMASSVTATFTLTTPTITVAKAGNGAGLVTATGIDCGIDCNEAVNYGTMLTLTAVASTGSTFGGWAGGGCSGTGTCTTTVTGATTVTATFTLTTYTLTATKAGTGQGTISAPGISCGVDCSEIYDYGTDVTLTAAPAAGSTFSGWSGGGCSGTGTCFVTITAAASVTATFTLTTHQLTVAKAGNGSGTVTSSPAGISCGVDCTELYGFGSAVTLTALPTTGSVFSGWSGGGCSGTGTCAVTISSATTVTATFTLTSSFLTVTPAGTGAGTVTANLGTINCPGDCNDPYNYGTVVTLIASAQAGSSFAGWSGGGCSGTGTCDVTMTGTTNVTATFTLGTNSMTVTTAGNGSGTVTSVPAGISCGTDCSENFSNGTVVTLSAAPAAGSVFSGWSGGGCGGVGTCVVTISSAVTITATFTLTVHTLTVTPAGNGTGTVTSSPAGITCGVDCSEPYDYGTSVTLTASASAGSTFAGWSGGGCSGTGTCVVSVTAATTVTPTFSLIQYQLSVTKAGNGSGTVTSAPAGVNCGIDCGETYNNGTIVTLTAAASVGSTFTGWSGGGCSGTGTCQVTMSAATTVQASFTLTTHQLTVTMAGSGGTSKVNSAPAGIVCPGACSSIYDYGTDVTLTPTTAVGFVFSGWSGGGCTGTGQCIVTMTGATAVTATFAPATYTLSVNVAGNGSGSVASSPIGIGCPGDCSELYNYNTVVTLTPTPAIGSVFTGWAGACTGAGACVVTMTAAASVTATFTLTTNTLTVTKSGTGTGLVTSSPIGITCGIDCNEIYNYGTVVALTATPPAGSRFVGWSGACSGNGACNVTMTAVRNVNAQFDTIPPNYVFVTSTTQTGNLGGLAGADAICQARATAGGLPAGGTYRAYLSSSTMDAPARLGSARGWIRRDGKPVADTVSDLTQGHLFYPIKLDELGTAIPENVFTMTATNASGTFVSTYGNCGDYTSSNAALNVFGGWATANSNVFSGYAAPSCAAPMRIYCFGIDNQAVVKPPPVTARQAFVSSVWIPGGGIAAADAVCASDATAAGLAGTYKALLPTISASAISRFDTSAAALPWARPDQTLMAPTASALASFSLTYLDASPNSNAANTAWFGQTTIWTGAANLVSVGTVPSTCNNWTDPAGSSFFGLAGYSWVSQWFAAASGGKCDYTYFRMVCLQQ